MTSSVIPVLLLSNRLVGGGVERHVSDLREGLSCHGFHCLIAAFCPSPDSAEARGYIHLPLYRTDGVTKSVKGFIRSVLMLRRLVRQENVRLVHTHSRYAALIGFVLGIFCPGLIRLHTIHNHFTDLRWFPLYPKTLIAISEALAELFHENTRLVQKRRISVIRHGILLPEGSENRQTSGIQTPSRYLYVGRMVEEKGVRLLLEIAARMHGETGMSIVMRGDGPLAAEVREMSEELGPEILTYEGYTSHPFKDAVSFDALLFPSTAVEGLGLVILEAYAHRLPVIAHPLPVLRDIVLDGRTGILVHDQTSERWLDAMRVIADDQELATTLGRQAREFVNQGYALSRMLDETAALYRRILES